MTSLPSLDSTVRQFRRRVVLARALVVVRSGVLLLAGFAVFAVIALRLFDVQVTPTETWLLALLLPIGAGLFHGLRATPGPMAFASHVDRRGYGMGLLLASIERDLGTWSEDAAQRLAAAQKALPEVRPLGAIAAVVVSVVGVGLLAFLPQLDPVAGSGTSAAAIAGALESARDELDLVRELALAEEEEAARLEQRLDALEQRIEEQQAVGWSDVDAFVDAVREAGEESARGHEAVRARSAELASALASRDAEEQDRRELAALAARARDLGMFDGLPPDVQKALESLARRGGAAEGAADGEAGGTLDPESLDAERIRELARALADRGKVRLDHAKDKLAGRVDAEALQRLLDQQDGGAAGAASDPMQAQGEGWDPTPGEDGAGVPGRGGLGRGRADATLDHLGATEVDLSGLRAEQLPDGIAPPDKWDVAGIGRAEPEVAPERARPGTGRAPSGGPGSASARRNLAPRHRDAVRRFFEGGGR